MSKKGAINRLRKELKVLLKDPVPYIHVAPNEANFLLWSYLLEGPPNTPYEGGWYWGRLRFKPEYPFKPPAILMVTPSGRFRPDTRLCLSMSDYHPETWNPAWSLSTVLTGLLSFMVETTNTTGAVASTEAEKRAFAAQSLEWNMRQKEFVANFPDIEDIVAAAKAAKAKPAPTSPNDSADAVAAVGAEVAADTEVAAQDAEASTAVAACRAALDALGEEVAASGDAVMDFYERAGTGSFRVAALRDQKAQTLDEKLTQMLITVDAVDAPAALRQQRKALTATLQSQSEMVAAATALAAAHAERPEEAVATRRAESAAAIHAPVPDLDRAIKLLGDALIRLGDVGCVYR